jgi:hypothetical protein
LPHAATWRYARRGIKVSAVIEGAIYRNEATDRIINARQAIPVLRAFRKPLTLGRAAVPQKETMSCDTWTLQAKAGILGILEVVACASLASATGDGDLIPVVITRAVGRPP